MQAVRRAFWIWAGIALLIGAREAIAHGDLHERIEALTAEIRGKPKQAELFLQRGELHRIHEDYALAAADFDRAEKLNPKLAAVWLARSQLLLAQRKFKEAQGEAERMLKVHPGHAAALEARARALSGRKRHLDAAETWRKVIAAAPTPDVEYYYRCAEAFKSAGERHMDEALRTVDDGLAKFGKVPTLGLYGIQLEVTRKRYEAAIERLDRLMPSTGRKETWLEMRGDILASSGKVAEAQTDYARALKELNALPPRLRSTPAASKLEERLRGKLKE